MPSDGRCVVPTALSSGAQKLGQPVPLSNLVVDEKSVEAQPAQANVPRRFSCRSGLVNGRSVASCRSTAYCSGVRSLRHSASVWVTSKVSAASASAGRNQPPKADAASPTTPLITTRRLVIIIERTSSANLLFTHFKPRDCIVARQSMDTLEQRTIAKVTARLVPFLIVCFFVAYLDRVNVSFAALTMNKDLGLSASAFGFGAGIFFLAYFLFEVPSNLFLERVGARKWIARIMFTWGLISGAMAFIGGETELLRRAGAARASPRPASFPGIIFFLTLWFPAVYRARIIGYFMAAIPLSTVIGAPVSGLAARAGRRAWA